MATEQEKVAAECPHCALQVLAFREWLDKPIKCPQCNRASEFLEVIETDSESRRKAKEAVKAAGKGTGALLSKAAKFGIGKIKGKLARKEMTGRVISHFDQHLPTLDDLAAFQQDADAIGIELAGLGEMAMGSVRSSLQDLAENAGGDLAEALSIVREYGRAFDLTGLSDLKSILKGRIQAQRIRSGDVKPLAPEIIKELVVRSSEIVWYQTDAAYVNEKKGTVVRGLLSVTGVRLVFTSLEKPIEIPLQQLNSISEESGRVVIVGKSASTSGIFGVRQPSLLAAYLQHVLTTFHRHHDVGFEDGRKRVSIPQDVKHAVWQRDGGRCVECGADDYLEFDHVIPLSKGGANTIDNLQLLCARCNGKKGARI